MDFLRNNSFVRYVIRFLLTYAFCYYASVAMIGITAPGGYYNAFIDHYLNFIDWLRTSLLYGTKLLLKAGGIDTYFAGEFVLRKMNGRGIKLVYGCLGYGVMSFWIAFVTASAKSWKNKIKWLAGGLFIIWFINITRMAMLLVATNNNWKLPLGWDHHTWFNVMAYIAILLMMYFFARKRKHVPAKQ